MNDTTTEENAYEDDFPADARAPAATEETISPRIRGDKPAVRTLEGNIRAELEPTSPTTERPQGALLIARSKLQASPTNPRKTFRHLEELADSIRAHGILQPVVARPRGTNGGMHYELIFGERRLRAADLAGLTEIPALVREMSDLEVLEVQIVENVQREDVDALEEADGYRLLHEKHDYSVPDIAAKIGKSVAYVYARLKLCALGPEGRAALAAGKLTDSTALLVARIPLALQADAVKELEPRQHFHEPGDWEDEDADEDGAPPKEGASPLDPVGAREALARIQSRFMLRLAEAPFDPKDATLVAAAGACSSCPKRTGTQPELFADVKAADTCTDPTCFGSKRDATWVKQKAAAKADGQEVVEGKKAKEYYPYGSSLSHTSGMVDLDAPDYGDPKRRSTREQLGERLTEKAAPVTLVRTDDGKVHQLVPAKDVKKLLPRPKDSDGPGQISSHQESAAEKMKREATEAGNLAALALVVKKVEQKELTREHWRILVQDKLDNAYGRLDDVFVRRSVIAKDDAGDPARKKIDVALSRLDVNALRGLFVELVLESEFDTPSDCDPISLFCRELKIDVKQLVAKELARLKGGAKKPAAAPASVPKKTASQPKKAAAKTPKKKASNK